MAKANESVWHTPSEHLTEIAKKICFKAGSIYSRLASNHVYSPGAIEKYDISDLEKKGITCFVVQI